MFRTLQRYLARDLVRTCLLALVALTLMMTIFVVVEPLRKHGLSSGQAALMFVFTLPAMLSFTLPVAALFATTIVYGRFSQDNELLACRASGIGTMAVLRPAVVLGAVVTLASLALSNFVSPRLIARGEAAARQDAGGIMLRQIRTRGCFRSGSYLIHADTVSPDGKELVGLVAADTSRPSDVRILVAGSARVEFRRLGDEVVARILLRDTAAAEMGRQDGSQLGEIVLDSPGLPDYTKLKTSFFAWRELMEMRRDPSKHAEVRRELKQARRKLCHNALVTELAEAISEGKPYTKLRAGETVYEIMAGGARAGLDSATLTTRRRRIGPPQRVEVKVVQAGKEVEVITADAGEVEARWESLANVSLVSIRLRGAVEVVRGSGQGASRHRREEWARLNLPIPEDVAARIESIDPHAIYRSPRAYIKNPRLLKEVEDFKRDRIRRILDQLEGEMHARLAYGVSCLLMVAMGAALGLLFRGGQFVSAFALSMMPAMVVIVMIVMGRQLLENPNLSRMVGMLSLWGGVAILAAADVAVFAYLARK